MSFSQEWDVCYDSSTQLSIWPWSDVVSLVSRHCKSIPSSPKKVLEFGCGAGANIPFFMASGWDYCAIEGSPTIVKVLHSKYPLLKEKIVVGDFTSDKPFFFGGGADLILDRSSLTTNDTAGIRSGLLNAVEALKPGGLFVGVDWFSAEHSEFANGEPCDDEYTKKNFKSGQFTGLGKVHFSTESHLKEVFEAFEILVLDHKVIHQTMSAQPYKFASWNIVAQLKSR